MSRRAVPPILLLALAAGAFVWSLVALSRRDDVQALLAVACAGLALRALRRSIDLLEGT